MFYLWGYTSAFVVYSVLCYFFPAQETYLLVAILDDSHIVSGVSIEKTESETPTKKVLEVDQSIV